MCRTTFATLFEGDIKDAQEMLGHHSAAFTLQVYRKPIFARQQRAVEELDSRLKVVPIRKGA
jgi:integrase